jgi:hypothetical protein
MPIDYQIDHARRLVSAKSWGVMADADVFAYQKAVWTRPDVAGYHELMDMSAVENIATPSIDRLRELARISAAMDVCSPSKFAIFAPSDLTFGFGRMYQAYRSLNERSVKRVGVFRSLAEALAFLEAGDEPDEPS